MWKVNCPVLRMHGLVSVVTGLLAVLFIVPSLVMANECFPSLDKGKHQYIVGYGNMHYEPSITSTSDGRIPVWVDGFRRGWLTRTSHANVKVTDLGVISFVGGRFNGVLIALPSSQIKSMDRQQKRTCRVLVNPDQLTPMNNGEVSKDSQFWLYQTQNKYNYKPAGSYPIVMSDVDEFLTGCIEQSEHFSLTSFAQDCVTTTWNWSSHWVNDRLHPLKVKPAQIRRQQVDMLLRNLEGSLYEKVRAQ